MNKDKVKNIEQVLAIGQDILTIVRSILRLKKKIEKKEQDKISK